MSKITNKQITIISDVDFNNKKIVNAQVEGYTSSADVNSEIVAYNKVIDTTLNKNSYNAITNSAVVQGLNEIKVSVVDNFVDTLPIATTLGQSVLNTTDNKIYIVENQKELNDSYTIQGSLNVNSNGEITNLTNNNYFTQISGWWQYTFPLRLHFHIKTLTGYHDETQPIYSIIRADDNSTLFEILFRQGSYNSLIINKLKRDGTVILTTTYSSNTMRDGDYIIEIKNNYIKIYYNQELVIIKEFPFEAEGGSTSDFYYDIQGISKISNKEIRSGTLPSIINYFPIDKVYGMDSYITSGSYGSAIKHNFIKENEDILVWNNGIEINNGKLIYNLQDNKLYIYAGENLIPIGGQN